MPSQQAVAQAVTGTESIELEQSAYGVLEYLRLFVPIPLRDPEFRRLGESRFLDNTPLLQNDVPLGLGLGSEATSDREGLPSQACGIVNNGNGTVSFVGEGHMLCQKRSP